MSTEIVEVSRASNPEKSKTTKTYEKMADATAKAVVAALDARTKKRRKRRTNPANPANPKKRKSTDRRRRRRNPEKKMDISSTAIAIGAAAGAGIFGHLGATFATQKIVEANPGMSWLKPGYITGALGLGLSLWPKAPDAVKAAGIGLAVAGAMSIFLPMINAGLSQGYEDTALIQDAQGRLLVPVAVDSDGEVYPLSDYMEAGSLADMGYDVGYMQVLGQDMQGNLLLAPIEEEEDLEGDYLEGDYLEDYMAQEAVENA